MDQSLQHALTLWIQSIQKSQDFIVQQAPSIIQQWLHVALVLDIVGSVVCVFCFLSILSGFVWYNNSTRSKREINFIDDDWVWLILLLGLMASGISTVAVLVCNVYDILMIELAPKVWILMKATDLARSLHH